MRLPIVKKVVQFIDENDAGQVEQAAELLTEIAEARGIKDEEMVVIGELLSNMFGGLEVAHSDMARLAHRLLGRDEAALVPRHRPRVHAFDGGELGDGRARARGNSAWAYGGGLPR